MAESTAKITRDDIEARLRTFKGEIDDRTAAAKRSAAPIVAGGSLVALVLVYLLGRRTGRKRSTVVEVRRV